MRLIGRGSGYVPTGHGASIGVDDFIGNVLTSDPVRYARNMAVLEEAPELGIGSPTIAWADAALRLMKQFAAPGYAGSLRQPILMVAAGRDEVVSTPAIENFGMHLRAGSHLIVAGAQHEILQEQDQFRAQFWAAFDAFVPGTPLLLAVQYFQRRLVHASVAGGDDAAAALRRAVVPGGDDAAGAGDDRNERARCRAA